MSPSNDLVVFNGHFYYLYSYAYRDMILNAAYENTLILPELLHILNNTFIIL